MKTDGIYGVKVVEVPAKYGKPITVYFIGDVHYNSPAFAKEKWKYDTDRMRREQKNGHVYYILDGDIFEAFSTSERRSYVVNEPHDSNKKRWEREYAQEVKQFVKENDFLVGRTLSVYGGNHFFQFSDGTTSDQALARELGCPYVGVCGYTILNLNIRDGRCHTVKIFVHHGKSSGNNPGSMFNALTQAASFFVDADILIMGHDHKMGAIPMPAIRCDMGCGRWKTKEVHRIVGRSGSYLKAYEEGCSSYAVDAMYRPSTLGSLPIVLTPTRHQPAIKTGRGREDNCFVEIESIVRA